MYHLKGVVNRQRGGV